MQTEQELEQEKEDMQRMAKLESDHEFQVWVQDEADRHRYFPWAMVVVGCMMLIHVLMNCHG